MACGCDPSGSLFATSSKQQQQQQRECNVTTGACRCKENVQGDKCDTCKPGYFNLSASNPLGCSKCECNPIATRRLMESANDTAMTTTTTLWSCDPSSGDCECSTEWVQGTKCDSCMETRFNLTSGCADECACDPLGSLGPTCDPLSGQCVCNSNIGGRRCQACQLGYFDKTRYGCISKCDCSEIGSFNSSACDEETGQCECKPGYGGLNCDECSNGYWKTADSRCLKCLCQVNGVLDKENICDQVIYIQLITITNKMFLLSLFTTRKTDKIQSNIQKWIRNANANRII